jgi:PAS domain S-box-containing protein
LSADDRRLPEALAQVEELEQIYRSAPVGLCLVDRGLRFRRINERLAAINGRSVEAHLGRTVEEVVPDLASQILPRYRKVLTTGQPIENVEVTGVLPSAPEVPHTWLVSDRPVKDAGGAVTGIITVVQDITERQRRQEELRSTRARLMEAERIARLGCWEWNLVTGEVWWSDATYRMLGFRPQSVRPEIDTMIEQLREEDRSKVRAQLDALYAGADTMDTELHAIGPDGEEHVLHARAHLTRNEDGAPHVLLGTTQDVTPQRRAIEALEAERAARELERAGLERLLEERTRELDRALDRLRRRKR